MFAFFIGVDEHGTYTSFRFILQTVKDFLTEYESKVASELRDDHRGYVYDAVWAMALALNRTISTMSPGTVLDKVPYGDKTFAEALTKALRGTNFSGVTVSPGGGGGEEYYPI